MRNIVVTWLCFLAIYSFLCPSCSAQPLGRWELFSKSIGISAMHMQLLRNNKVVIFDLTSSGASKIDAPEGRCRPKGPEGEADCTAHSVELDLFTKKVRPMFLLYDTWCSSGSVLPNGTFIQSGGEGDGQRTLREFTPCDDGKCDWIEYHDYLVDRKWYATNHILPDGRIITVGGRAVYNYEFFPSTLGPDGKGISFYLPFLEQTTDPEGVYNNLYPFVFLLPDGNLFIFANKKSILLDYKNNKVVREYPEIPGVDSRNYPSTGNAVLLPLKTTGNDGDGAKIPAEVVVCGGAPPGAFLKADRQKPKEFVPSSKTCVRIKATDPNPKWETEDMPMPRLMQDMVLLPTGDVFLVNGASRGSAGWEDAEDPTLVPLLYKPDQPNGNRFTMMAPSKVPRLYHSTALLLPDGKVLVGGSNTHQAYIFNVKYPTDLSLEVFSPPYLDKLFDKGRTNILTVDGPNKICYAKPFKIEFKVHIYMPNTVSVVLMIPPFVTHSFSQNQRSIVLNVNNVVLNGKHAQATVDGPPSNVIAPPGYYLLFVIHDATPSPAVWVKVE